MQIEQQKITIGQLSAGYGGNGKSVFAGGGKLDIQPPYRRDFVYKTQQRNAVIETVRKDDPLNVMYWAVRDDGDLEIIDGQQRAISICEYVEGNFSVGGLCFHNLPDEEQEKFLAYKLTVYFCAGTNGEKLEWLKTVELPGKKLTPQELRNAVYSGSWVADAKRYFGKYLCVAYQLGGKYLAGVAARQDYLETAIQWYSNGDIEGYMEKHQHKEDAKELWEYFQKVIAWVKTVFPKYRKEMKGLPWGEWYNQYKDKNFDAAALEKEVSRLMENQPATKKAGVYGYLLTGEGQYLNTRNFGKTKSGK